MRIIYKIQDGYGKGLLQRHIIISDDELNQCESYEEKKQLVNKLVRENFQKTVYPYWDESQLKQKE